MFDAGLEKLAEIAEHHRRSGLSDHAVLEELVIDNPDLEQLEALLNQFNIFEAIGMARQELKHSNFLGFLLDPRQSHGLGDFFLRRFLQKVLLSSREREHSVSLIDLDVWDLDETDVRREWRNIDVLIVNEKNKFVVIIENKVDAGEGADQLGRYLNIVNNEFPDWKILAFFLTPAGMLPSNSLYVPVNYDLIADLVDSTISHRSSTLGTDLLVSLSHYRSLLRRHIVEQSDIDDLCIRIYSRHKRALDLIYERIPDRLSALSAEITKMVKDTPGFVLAKASKSRVTCFPEEWNELDLGDGTGWYPGKQILVFFFENIQSGLRLCLEIQPGPEDIRQRLYTLAQHTAPLRASQRQQGPKYSRIYVKPVLTAKAIEQGDEAVNIGNIHRCWSEFRRDDLPQILEIVKTQNWLTDLSDPGSTSGN